MNFGTVLYITGNRIKGNLVIDLVSIYDETTIDILENKHPEIFILR